MDLQLRPFSTINLSDPFFDSLKVSYPEFSEWFKKKANQGAMAYVFYFDDGRVADFLYMKIETEAITDIEPVLPAKRRLKVGTFKLLSRGTRRGERFMKKIKDTAIAENVDEIYVTIFPTPELEYLIKMFERYGFIHIANKPHSEGPAEWVLVRKTKEIVGNVIKDYPLVKLQGCRKWLLSIKPEFHTALFPDSILANESYDVVQDVTHTNGIYKTYISWATDCAQLIPGDLIVIYRMKDNQGPAKYRSVATSLCTVIEVKNRSSFNSEEEFLSYTQYSVFDKNDLQRWFKQGRDFIVIKMLYNVAFTNRVIRNDLIEIVGLDGSQRWTIIPLSEQQLRAIIDLGRANTRYFIE